MMMSEEAVEAALPQPAEGCELWEVYSDEPYGRTLFVRPIGRKDRRSSLMLGDLASDTHSTGWAWWKGPYGGWHVEINGVLRYEGRWPDFVEMRIRG